MQKCGDWEERTRMSGEPRFQFSLAAILIAACFAAVSINLFTAPKEYLPPWAVFWCGVASFACAGAAVVTLFGKPLAGAAAGLVIGLVFWFAVMALTPAEVRKKAKVVTARVERSQLLLVYDVARISRFRKK